MSSLFTKETKPNVLYENIQVNNNTEKYKDNFIIHSSCDEKYKEYLEIKYVQCLKTSYIKKEILENKCDLYIKEYAKCISS